MFDINFISEPGLQKKTSDASWSFLYKRSEHNVKEKSNLKPSKASFVDQNTWKYYAFVMTIISFIVVIEIINIRFTQVKPDIVLNQVIDLIVESGHFKNMQLEEAIFFTDKVKVTIRSEVFPAIQALTQGYRKKDKIPYEIYKKGKYSYLNLIFPWKGNEKGGDIQTLQSIALKTVFSNKISINHTEDIFEIQGRSSDIISFLLQMAENEQIQQFTFSISHYESGQFNLKIQLNSI